MKTSPPFTSPRHRLTVGLLLLGGAWGLSSTATAQDTDAWAAVKKDCELVLAFPERYTMFAVEECVVLQDRYRDLERLSAEERLRFARGPSWLFHRGSPEQRALGRLALEHLHEQPLSGYHRRRRRPPLVPSEVRPLARLWPTEPTPFGRVKATEALERAWQARATGDLAGAIAAYREALGHHPFSVEAKYGLLCAQSLAGNDEAALRTLLELESWDFDEAQSAFRRARTAPELEPMIPDVRFGAVVGWPRVQVLNGGGEGGLDETRRIVRALASHQLAVHQVGTDRHRCARPRVYYRPGWERAAREAWDLVGDVATVTGRISWDSPFDLIIVWGEPGPGAHDARPGSLASPWQGIEP